MILVTKLRSKATVTIYDQFIFVTQLDVEKPETYCRAMTGPNTQKLANNRKAWAVKEKWHIDSYTKK